MSWFTKKCEHCWHAADFGHRQCCHCGSEEQPARQPEPGHGPYQSDAPETAWKQVPEF